MKTRFVIPFPQPKTPSEHEENLAEIKRWIENLTTRLATATWDPANIATGAATSTTVTVNGAQIGQAVAVGFSNAVPAGTILSGAVTAADTVTVTLSNLSGGAVDLSSGTLSVQVWK